jgi:hypothetical protein
MPLPRCGPTLVRAGDPCDVRARRHPAPTGARQGCSPLPVSETMFGKSGACAAVTGAGCSCHVPAARCRRCGTRRCIGVRMTGCQDAFRSVRFWSAALASRCLRTTSSTVPRRGSAGSSQSRQAHHDGASHACGADPTHGVHTRRPCSPARGDSGITPCYFVGRNKPTEGKGVVTRHRTGRPV